MRTRLPGPWLTVVFRDDSPMTTSGDGPTYRSVRVRLTDEQRSALARRHVLETMNNGQPHDHYEEVSRAFLEPDDRPDEPATAGGGGER